MPLVEQLAWREPAVQHGDLAREALGEPAHRLRREGDLRHEHDAALAGRHGVVERGEVDLRFAGAGDAVEEEGLAAAGDHRGLDRLVGCSLLGRQRWGRAGFVATARQRVALDALVAHIDEAGFGKGAQIGNRSTGTDA